MGNITIKSQWKGVCECFIHFNSVSCSFVILNLAEEFSWYINFCTGCTEIWLLYSTIVLARILLAHLNRSLQGSLQYRQGPSSIHRPSVHPSVNPSVHPSTISNDFSSETTGPIASKFHVQHPGPLGKKSCSNCLGHMTNMAAMPIYGKNLKKSSPQPIDQWPWNLVCSIVYGSTTKVVQIMTLDWPRPILRQGQIWSNRLLYGEKVKIVIF